MVAEAQAACSVYDSGLRLFPEWLDDIGLPQYKDIFSDARIDARMLHYLTVVRLRVASF